MINSGIISLKISKFYLILCIIFCIKYNSGGSGTVTAGLPQGETKGFYHLKTLENIDNIYTKNVQKHLKTYRKRTKIDLKIYKFRDPIFIPQLKKTPDHPISTVRNGHVSHVVTQTARNV